MWHDNLQAFWDGANQLVIGLGSGLTKDDSPAGLSAIGVFTAVDVAAVDETHAFRLIGVLEATGAPTPWYLIGLPPSHRYVRLRRGDDPEGADDIELVLVRGPISGGEWRVAIAQAGINQLFEFFDRAAAVREDEVIRLATSQIRTPMLWGVIQRRRVDRKSGLVRIQIGATRLFWPRESRISVDNNISRPAEHDVGALRLDDNTPNAPAIHARLRADVAPTIRLRIYLGSAGRIDEAFLGRVVLVHVMHQRRHLEAMNRSRQQDGKAVVEPLAIEQVVQHLPKTYQDHHVAVDVDGGIAAINLAAARLDRNKADARGFELIDVPGNDGCIDVNFYGAVLGDDIGLASNAIEGHIQVRGKDPGGFTGARLFRVTETGLQPYPVDEKNIAELMELVAYEEGPGSSAAPSDQESDDWDQFCQRLALPQTGERIEHLLYEDIGLFVLAAWSNALARGDQRGSDIDGMIESLKLFRTSPALLSALAPRLPLIGNPRVPHPLPVPTPDHPFIRCYAECMGSPNLVGENLDPQAEFEAWQVLAKPEFVRQLLSAQVCLTGSASEIRSKHELAATQLHDGERVEDFAQAYKDRRSSTAQFEDLNAYLEVRRSGDWVTLAGAALVAKHCKDIEDQRKRIRDELEFEGPGPTEHPRRDHRNLGTLLAEVEKLTDAGRKIPEVAHRVERIAREIERMRDADSIDRTILRDFEEKLHDIVDSRLVNQLTEEVVAAIQAWARLPNFLEKMAPRIRRNNGADQRGMRELLRDYVNRVQRSVPKLGAGAGISRFNRLRSDLEARIKTKLAADGAQTNGAIGAERQRLADDLAGYADILLHHNAYCCILDLINGAEHEAGASRTFGEIKLQLSTWPHRATETWERASAIAEAQYGTGQENPLSRLALPTV